MVRGATAFLSCEFEPDVNISHLVINWQRQEDAQVVHSFYYQKDQLERQSKDYFGRTNLNHSELAQGNASLSIANFGLKDAGKYLCTVSNTKGTGKGELQLVYAGKGQRYFSIFNILLQILFIFSICFYSYILFLF